MFTTNKMHWSSTKVQISSQTLCYQTPNGKGFFDFLTISSRFRFVTVLNSQLQTSLSNDCTGRGVGLKVRATTKAHHALHLLISCLTYTSSTAEGSRESNNNNNKKKTSQVCSRGERDMLIRCYSNQSWQTHTHTSALTHTHLKWLVGLSALCTSLCVVIGCAPSGQQLSLQAFDLGIFGGQELLQLWYFCLWRKAERVAVN